MTKLKVYRWQSHRRECPTHHRQTHEVVAAKSKAEVARIAGYDRPSQMFNLAETGNARDVATAMAEPGVIFWRPINDYEGAFTRVPPREIKS